MRLQTSCDSLPLAHEQSAVIFILSLQLVPGTEAALKSWLGRARDRGERKMVAATYMTKAAGVV